GRNAFGHPASQTGCPRTSPRDTGPSALLGTDPGSGSDLGRDERPVARHRRDLVPGPGDAYDDQPAVVEQRQKGAGEENQPKRITDDETDDRGPCLECGQTGNSDGCGGDHHKADREDRGAPGPAMEARYASTSEPAAH